jgi:hypothetical protein
MGEREQLRELGDERVPLQPGFHINAHVLQQAAQWPLIWRDEPATDQQPATVYYACQACEQAIAIARKGQGTYQYGTEEFAGLVLAHLMQRHRWTRERIGEH